MRVSLILLILVALALFFFFNKGSPAKKCNCGNRDPVYLDDPGTNLDQPIQYGEFLNPSMNGV